MKCPLLLPALAFALLVFGCLGIGEQQKQAPPAGGMPPLPNPEQNATQNQANSSEPEKILTQNDTGPMSQEQNYTDPFAGIIPRNISGSIGEGRFRINEVPGAPLKIHVIRAGSGDAVLVNKGEFYMLVDAGDGQAVTDYLRKLGVMRLNVLVATRDDPIAVSGMQAVLDGFYVDEFWDNGLPASSSGYAEVLSAVLQKKIFVKQPTAGDRMEVGGLEVVVLNPQKSRLGGNPDVDAIVMKLSSSKFCALLLNPTVQERENALLSEGESLRCDVATYFKQGEGRSTPSLIFENSAPKDVIISVGAGAAGLPSNTTLERLSMKNETVWRTDAQGTIVVFTEGQSGYRIEAAN